MALKTKKIYKRRRTRHFFSDREVQILRNIIRQDGVTSHSAAIAKKLLKYPEFPKRTVGAIKNKMHQLNKDLNFLKDDDKPEVNTTDNFHDAGKKLTEEPIVSDSEILFKGHITNGRLVMSIEADIKSLMK